MADMPVSYLGSVPGGYAGMAPNAGGEGPDWGAVKKLQDSYVTQGSALGFDPSMLKSMGANQLMGFVEGVKLRTMLQHAGMQQQVTAEKLREAMSSNAASEALPGFAKDYGDLSTDQPQEGDFGNEAPPAVAGMDPKRALVEALRRNPKAAQSPQLDNLIGALQRGRDYLPLGQTVDVPGIGKLVGTGTGQPHFAATMSPEDVTVWQDPMTGTRLARSGKSVVKLGVDPEAVPTAGKWPWLMDEDPKKFLAGLQSVDPKERDLALATRIKVNHAMGKTDEMQELMGKFLKGEQSAPTGEGFFGWLKKTVGLGGAPSGTATGASAQPQAGASDRVKVKAPNGKVGTIPKGQLEEAKRAGYSLAE